MKNSKIDNFLKVKKELGNKVILNEPMAFHTTLDIGGPARLLSEVNEDEELIKLVKLAFKYKIPYIVIGEGSDLLVSDLGFMGFVIINKVDDVRINGSKIMVKSGTNLQKFINFTIGKGYSGIEKMSGIPGTVGGAIYGNAGAYGQTISDHILKVKTFNGKIIKWYTKTDCKFSYRDSIFKKKNETILEAEFEFEKGVSEFMKKVSLDIIAMRSQKYPPGIKCPGSFFKNIIADELSASVLNKIAKEKIVYGKIPAGYLMQEVGARGQQRGSVKIADYHGNLIVNLGNGKADDFYSLAYEYANKVEKKFGIKLEAEVQYLHN